LFRTRTTTILLASHSPMQYLSSVHRTSM
jgi:hypothetical protein